LLERSIHERTASYKVPTLRLDPAIEDFAEASLSVGLTSFLKRWEKNRSTGEFDE
jgi:hypothetical protein